MYGFTYMIKIDCTTIYQLYYQLVISAPKDRDFFHGDAKAKFVAKLIPQPEKHSAGLETSGSTATVCTMHFSELFLIEYIIKVCFTVSLTNIVCASCLLSYLWID